MNKLKFISAFVLLFLVVFFSCTTEPYGGAIIDPNIPTVIDSAILPVLTTNAVINVSTTTASSGGNITADGGFPVIARGIVWSTTQNPTIANSKTTNGTGVGNFVSSITNLTNATIYYIRAYATNANGTTYGNQVTFTTISVLNFPSLTTIASSYLGANVATSGGNIASDGGFPITARGVAYSQAPNPTIANQKTVDGTGSGNFSSSLVSLISNTTYYLRAYATNSVGTSYGNEVTISTNPIYTIGSIGPAGGFVFSISSNGQNGMEVAPVSTQFQTQWGCYSTDISGTSNAVGSGLANTNLILAFHNSIGFYSNPAQCQTFVSPIGVITSTGDVAAKKCDNLIFNGFTDWYLPSSGELMLIYTNLHSQGIGDFTNQSLASSTQSTNGDVKKIKYVIFTGGIVADQGKYNLIDYRAIRNF